MSYYVTNKQILYPVEKQDSYLMTKYFKDDDHFSFRDIYDLEFVPELQPLWYNSQKTDNPGFQTECFVDRKYNCNYYLAYTLDSKFKGRDDWKRVRELYDSEKVRYKKIFEQILPIDENKLKLVEYCYYNGCDADDPYVDNSELDSFYKEV